jgi:hypothetical protein
MPPFVVDGPEGLRSQAAFIASDVSAETGSAWNDRLS